MAPSQLRGAVCAYAAASEPVRFISTETPKPAPKDWSRTTSFPLVVKLSVAAKQGDRMKRVFSVSSTANSAAVFA